LKTGHSGLAFAAVLVGTFLASGSTNYAQAVADFVEQVRAGRIAEDYLAVAELIDMIPGTFPARG
jgi:hypothetical protein